MFYLMDIYKETTKPKCSPFVSLPVTVVEHYNIIRQPWLTTYERVRACEGYTGGMGGTPICIHVVMLKIPELTVNYFSDTLRGKFH